MTVCVLCGDVCLDQYESVPTRGGFAVKMKCEVSFHFRGCDVLDVIDVMDVIGVS